VVIATAKRARYWNALSAILATKVGGLTRVYVTVPALPQFVEKVEADTVKLQSMDCPLALSAISDCPSVLQLPEPGLPGPVHVKVPPCSAAAAHFVAATRECPFIEFLPYDLSESALRRELVTNEPQLIDGVLPLPPGPGLGIELNVDALREFESFADRMTSRN
jgi:hypothetical protein